MPKLYNVGIYTRLSIDDANNSQKAGYIPADGSGSIENQKLLLSQFAMLSGWLETRVYTDDGFSGGNFERPGFKKMLEDAKAGIINLILVKDLSRLGRDYIEVGRYIDDVFPSLGCRFVSLLDEIDTANDDNLMLPIRALMNDYQLKDLSGKIKASLRAKVDSGQFLSAYTTYGYRKSPEDRHKLIVDDYAADMVRRIFTLRADGYAYGRIAGLLNTEGIQTPRAHWREITGKSKAKPTLWGSATVKEILRNEIYIGHLIQHHTGTMSYKNHKQIKKPQEEWVRHENNHEAIIDLASWEKVQAINRTSAERNANCRKPEPSLFMQKLFCMDCGAPLTSTATIARQKNGETKRYPRYYCSRHMTSGRTSCSWHTIGEKSLIAIILTELHAHAVTLDENAVLGKLKKHMSLDSSEQLSLYQQEAKSLERRLLELERITTDLYEDKVTSKITELTFTTLMNKNEQERQIKQVRYDEVQSIIAAENEKHLSVSNWAEVVHKHIHLRDLSRANIEELIDHIEVGESDYTSGARQQEIKIYWRFVGCLND